jgi:ABC-type siderophore export system fused ATPase/permease subunit
MEILSTLTNDSKAVTALWRDNFRTSYWHTNEHEFLCLLNVINSYFGTNTISALKYQTDLDRRALLTAIGESEKSVLLVFNANDSDKAFIRQFFDESKAKSRTMKVILFSHDNQSPWCIGF